MTFLAKFAEKAVKNGQFYEKQHFVVIHFGDTRIYFQHYNAQIQFLGIKRGIKFNFK